MTPCFEVEEKVGARWRRIEMSFNAATKQGALESASMALDLPVEQLRIGRA